MPGRRMVAGVLTLVAALAVIVGTRSARKSETKHLNQTSSRSPVDTQPADDRVNLDALISHLKAIPRKLINQRLTASCIEEKLAADGTTWNRTPVETQEDVYLDGMPGGKARIDCHKQVGVWIAGAAPYYSNDAFSAAFNGKNGTTLTPRIAEGSFLPGPPPLLDAGDGSMAATGFSIYYWDRRNKRGLGEFLENIDRRFTTVTPEIHDGVQTIRIEISNSRFSEKFWLDPARGYSLLAHIITNTYPDGTTLGRSRGQVTKLIEAAPNVWFPAEAFQEFGPTDGTRTRVVFNGSNIVANDKNFDESIFTIAFAPGVVVDDRVSLTKRTRSAVTHMLSRVLSRVGTGPGPWIATAILATIFIAFAIALYLRRKTGIAILLPSPGKTNGQDSYGKRRKRLDFPTIGGRGGGTA